MLNVKEAAKKAMAFVADIYAGDPINELRLEEVDFEEIGASAAWFITVSFSRADETSPLPKGLFGDQSREYKMVSVDAQSGEINSMKQRVFQ